MSEHDDHTGAGQFHADESARAGQPDGTAWWQPASLLTPASSAVAAFAVAVVTLSGQNLLLVGIQSLLGQGFGSGISPASYHTVWGVAALVPLVLVVLLARIALRATPSGWEATLGRAAMVLAAIAAVGAAFTALGGVLNDGPLPF